MRGYGMGTNLAWLLEKYWKLQRIVPKACKSLGVDLGTGRGVTHGDPASPMIFNVMVDVVVRAVIEEVFSLQEEQHGMGWAAGERNVFFYEDYVRV